jgi:hypothetical protein
MNTYKHLIRRAVLAAFALSLMVDRGMAQTSFQSGAQDVWNYTGTYASLPSPNNERRCIVATADGVYVGTSYPDGLWYIEKYDSNGVFVLKFPKSFTRIIGLAANASGDTIYGFDGAVGKGWAFSPVGEQKFQFGSGYGGNANGWFSGTYRDDVYNAVAVNSQGLIYVTDYYNYRVQIFTETGAFSSAFGIYGSLPGQFSNAVRHVAVGPRDEVIVLDDNVTLQKFSPTGEYISKMANSSPLWDWASWARSFAMTRDGILMVGMTYTNQWWGSGWPLSGVMVDSNTMVSDRAGNNYISADNVWMGYVNFVNSVGPGDGIDYVHGVSFDPAGNAWMIRHNTVTAYSWSVEKFERRMRFDNHKPMRPVLQPTILSALQQPGSQTVNITYKVDSVVMAGGSLSGGPLVLSGGTLTGGTLSGGSISNGGSVSTALVGWLYGVKNWAHLVVPSVSGSSMVVSGDYFWSDMYDPATRIDGRPPLSDRIMDTAVDALGNVYVNTDYCIRKVTPSGVVSLFAGGVWNSSYLDEVGPTARFQNPRGICADNNGNVYVTEYDGRVIRKITSSGVVSTLAGSWGGYASTDGVGSNARFRSPIGVAADASGNLFVSEWDSGYIRKVTSSGSVTTVGQTGTNIHGIAVDATGSIYVAAYNNHKIFKVVPNGTAAGIVTTFAGSGNASHIDGTGTGATFNCPRSVSIDPFGNLYVTEDDGNFIRKISPGGVVTTVGKTMGFVYNVSVDPAGNLYTAETNTQLGSGRMLRKGAPYSSGDPGIMANAGVLGEGIQTGTLSTVAWDVSKDLPGMNFASLAFEVLAKDDRPAIGAHFVTIPGESSGSDLKISNRPIDEAELSDLWVWLLANRDPRIAISGNSIVFTQAGLDYVANAPAIYDAPNPDTTVVVATGGTGGADGGWQSGSWGSTTNRGRAFAYKLMNYRPVTASEITRANAGRFNISAVDHYSAVNLAP